MSRLLYDSITAKDIPLTAAMVGGYVNGTYKWSATDWNRFPHAIHVPIATQANINNGVVLDIETGDALPSQGPDWVLRRRAAGIDPSVYCNLSTWPLVIKEFVRQGVTQPHYWIARYDNKAAMIANAVAKQYADPAMHNQGHFDLSIAADYWPGIDPPEGAPVSDQLDLIQNLLERISWRLWALTQGHDHLSVTLTNGEVLEEDLPLNISVHQLNTTLADLTTGGLTIVSDGQITLNARRTGSET